MKIFENFASKLKYILIALIVVSNVVLSSILFYMLAPNLSPHFGVEQSRNVLSKIMPITNADMIAIWSLNLDTNSRYAISYTTLNVNDNKMFTDFINISQSLKVAASLNPRVFEKIIGGHSICFNTADTGNIMNTAPGKLLINEYPNAMSCVFPIVSPVTGILNSYILMIWKNPLTLDEQNRVLTNVDVQLNKLTDTY